MTIGQVIDNLVVEITQYGTDLISGECFKNFKEEMIKEKQINTLIKVAIVALSVGIIVGMICGSGVVSALFAVTAGVAAFSYFTTHRKDDILDQAISSVKNCLRNCSESENHSNSGNTADSNSPKKPVRVEESSTRHRSWEQDSYKQELDKKIQNLNEKIQNFTFESADRNKSDDPLATFMNFLNFDDHK